MSLIPKDTVLNKFIKPFVLAFLVFITLVYSVPWTIQNATTKEYSGIDFHGYWYAGHFVRQGINSYAAILNNPKPNYWNPAIPGSGDPNSLDGAEASLELPVYYLDGYVARNHPIAQKLIVAPSVTAPLNLFLGLFSWFSWPVAQVIWIILNMVFAGIIPWVALRLLDKPHLLSLVDKLIFAFTLYNFYGLRQSIVVGQQSLTCLLLLLIALLCRDKWILSGVLLGFGISKYSVGLPIFLYFLLQKRYASVLVATAVQIIAVMILLPLKMGSPVNTLISYYKVIAVNYAQNGIHLPARFPTGSMLAVFLVGIIWLITILWISRKYSFFRGAKPVSDVVDLSDLNLITLAVFLTTYHRIHDIPFMVFFLLILVIVMTTLRNFSLNGISKIMLFSTTLVIIILLIFPTILMRMSNHITDILKNVEMASSLALTLMFILSIWFHPNLSYAKDTAA